MSLEWGNPAIAIVLDPVDEDITDIPVMVALSTSAGKRGYDHSKVFEALGSAANRKKIAITTDDRTTQCYVEIKEWDQANKWAWLWVRVPALSSTQTTTLYLHYDPNQADNTAYVGDTGEPPAQKVWNAGYGAVYTKPIPATKKSLYAGEVSSSAIGGAVANAQVAFGPIDCTGLIKGNGWLKIDLKCDLPENLTGGSQLEITSAGGPDTQEWHLVNVHGTYGISTEWRTYYLPLSAARTTGSELDPARINFIRWYVLMADGAPATTISWRNAEIISTADLPDGTNVPILLDATQNQKIAIANNSAIVRGPIGDCLSFNGTGYASTAAPVPISPSEGTISVWFDRAWPTNDGVTHGLVCIGGYVSGSHVDYRRLQMFKWAGNDNWYFRLGGDSSFNQIIVPDSGIPANSLTNITMVWSGGAVTVYRDGTAIGSFSQAAPSNWNTEAIEIGRAYGNQMMVGSVPLVEISHIPRSAAWIAATYSALQDELITYADPPVVAFTASLEGNTLTCTDRSTGEGITGWLWDFGDGHTSTEQNPVHVYQRIGAYQVTLTLSWVGGTVGPSNGGNEPIAVTTVILRIAVEGDTDTALPAHDPPEGGGAYPISPVDKQTHVWINDRRVVVVGEDFPVHCGTGAAGASSGGSPHVFINGIPVCREGDVSSAPHTMTGIIVSNNDHVFDCSKGD